MNGRKAAAHWGAVPLSLLAVAGLAGCQNVLQGASVSIDAGGGLLVGICKDLMVR